MFSLSMEPPGTVCPRIDTRICLHVFSSIVNRAMRGLNSTGIQRSSLSLNVKHGRAKRVAQYFCMSLDF